MSHSNINPLEFNKIIQCAKSNLYLILIQKKYLNIRNIRAVASVINWKYNDESNWPRIKGFTSLEWCQKVTYPCGKIIETQAVTWTQKMMAILSQKGVTDEIEANEINMQQILLFFIHPSVWFEGSFLNVIKSCLTSKNTRRNNSEVFMFIFLKR